MVELSNHIKEIAMSRYDIDTILIIIAIVSCMAGLALLIWNYG